MGFRYFKIVKHDALVPEKSVCCMTVTDECSIFVLDVERASASQL